MFRNVSSWLVPLTVVNLISCLSITLHPIEFLRDACADSHQSIHVIYDSFQHGGHLTHSLSVLRVFVKQEFKCHDHTCLKAMLLDVGS
jgi:hypothetical protein